MTKGKISLLLCLLLAIPTLADFKDWDVKDKNLWYSYLALQALDTLQTYDMIQCQKQTTCNFFEGNSFFGKKPKVHNIVISKVAASSVIFYLLDKQPDYRREKDLWMINGIAFAVVLNNHEVGVRFNYSF